MANLADKTILDEVQKVPELFSSIKMVVDNDRQPGRFILTGSANVLQMPRLSDSLAGRMGILRLYPLSQAELHGSETRFLESLFSGNLNSKKQESRPRLGVELANIVARGGYPEAIARTSDASRTRWHRDYIDTIIQRDIKYLARLEAVDSLYKLLELASNHTAQLTNISNLAEVFQLSRPTIGSYVKLLEQLFLLERLPAWYHKASKRLVKTPKLHIADTGLACSMLGLNKTRLFRDKRIFARMLETFVYQELRKYACWHQYPVKFSHFRDKDMVEVDIVLESETRVAGIEVKAGATIDRKDLNGLKKLRDATAEKFAVGVILYDGETTLSMGPKLYAVPISRLWLPQSVQQQLGI